MPAALRGREGCVRRESRRGHQPLWRTLVRALRLFLALNRSYQGLTLKELEDEAGCGLRQVYRYLDALEEAGVMISKRRTDYGRVVRRIDYIDGRRIRIA